MHINFICPRKSLIPYFLLSGFSWFMVHENVDRVFLEGHKSSESAKIYKKECPCPSSSLSNVFGEKMFVKIIHRGRPTYFHDTITTSGARANSVCKGCSTQWGVYIHTGYVLERIAGCVQFKRALNLVHLIGLARWQQRYRRQQPHRNFLVGWTTQVTANGDSTL